MNPSLLLAFWGVTVVLVIVPGPDWAYTLASGVRDRVVIPAVAGLMLGYAILTAVVAAGMGVLVRQNPIILTALTVIGASYLVYLGVMLQTRHGFVPSDLPEDAAVPLWWVRVLKGVGVSGLNPKGLLIFLALLPQFTDPRGTWGFPAQICALGLVFVATCGVFYSILGLSARTILRSRPEVSRLLSRLSGVAMILIGILLLIERMTSV